MIGAMLGGIFLRQIPDELRAGVTDGTLKVFGSAIRNAADGRLAGFLQEASPLKDILPQVLNSAAASGPSLVTLPMQAAQLVQGEFIRAGVQRIETGVKLLTQLGVADVALGAAGIGVSAVGFAVMAVKIDQVKAAVLALSGEVEVINAKLDRLQQDAIDADFSELRTLSKAFDEGWRLSGDAAERRWQDVARGALSCQSRFELRADRALLGGPAQYTAADPFLDAVSLASALRVAALAACNETNAAREAASDGARSLERMTGSIGMADLSLVFLTLKTAEPGTEQWTLAQAEANQAARQTARKIRAREASAVTRAGPLTLLEARAIAPREWLAAAREEVESPLLLLLADPSAS